MCGCNRPNGTLEQGATEGYQPEHHWVDDHPFGSAVAGRAERRRVAGVTHRHEHNEHESDTSREE